MLTKLSDWLNRLSNGWVTLAGLVIFILFTILVLPNQSSRSLSDIEPTKSPDLSFFYTPVDLYTMAESYGEQGRREYITARFTFDLVWPIVYMVFLTTALSWVSKRAFDAKSLWCNANVLPIFGGLFDYIENISIKTTH